MTVSGVAAPPPRVLALDVGKVRIGVALTDPLGYTAQPLLTVWRKSPGEDRRSLLRLCRKHGVAAIVVGNPLHMNGEGSPWAEKVQQFAADLHAASGLPVHLFDERLTTVEAHGMLDAAGVSASRHDRKHVIDQAAATVLLQDWLLHQAHLAAQAALRAGEPA